MWCWIAHLKDVFAHVDLEFETVAEETLELHDVEKNGPVLHRADEDGHPQPPRGREQRGLLDAQCFLDLGQATAEEKVQLGRGHALLELRATEEGGKQPVGLEEGLFPEPEVVDADDARQAVLKVPRRRVNLTDAVADDAVRIMVEVRAGRRHVLDRGRAPAMG